MELHQLSAIFRTLWKPLLALLVVALLISWIWNFINQGTLKLAVAPDQATVFVGSSSFNVSGTSEHKLGPGSYSVIVKKDGYLDHETTVKIKSREETKLTVNLVKNPVELASFARIPALSLDGASLVLLGADARIYRISSGGGGLESLSEPIFSDPTYLSWSPDRSRLLVTMSNNKAQLQQSKSPFYAASDPNFAEVTWIYDLTSQKISKIVTNATSVSWSGDGQAIFYVLGGLSPALYQANLNGTNVSKIIDLGSDRVILKPSPNGKHLAWYERPEGYGQNDIYLVNLATKTQEKLTSTGYSVGANWSSDSQLILVDKVSSQGEETTLMVIGVSDRSVREITGGGGAENSVWSSDSRNTYSFDQVGKSIVKVNVLDENVSKIAKLNLRSPTNFLVDKDEKNLYFTANETLYRLGLK